MTTGTGGPTCGSACGDTTGGDAGPRDARIVEALLSNGRVVTIRAVTPGDRDGIRTLHAKASEHNRRMRFFTADPVPPQQYADHLAAPDDEHLALVAIEGTEIVGVASAEVLAAGEREAAADVAVMVADRWHHTGVGTLLLEHLAAAARASGLRTFTADVLAANIAMLRVFSDAGFTVTREPPQGGVVRLAVDLDGTDRLAAAVADRERRSDAASIAAVLAPGSVAVVGAGRSPGGVGRQVLDNIVAGGFTGPVAAVNWNTAPRETIGGVPAFVTVTDVPWLVDLAVIAVPAADVAAILHDCGRAGVRAAVVLSSGFAEAGNRGRERELVAIAHGYGMRLVGPNCLGVVGSDPQVRLNATFAAGLVPGEDAGPARHGTIAVASQSGGLGVLVMHAAARRGLAVADFVSLGNKADVSGNDLLLYWQGDARLKVIALYLESIGNPRRFRRIAAAVAATTPVVALRGGRSAAGARAGAAHSAAAATPDAGSADLFRDSGVIAADTTEELLDLVALLASAPVPAGNRIAVLGNAGGPGTLTADAAEAAGGVVPRFSDALAGKLLAAVPGCTAADNPVDLGAKASPDDYRAALRLVLASPEVDAVVAIQAATPAQPTTDVVAAIEDVAREAAPGTPPIAGVVLGEDPPAGASVPWFAFGEPAARALARAGELGRWRSAPRTPATDPGRPGGADALALDGEAVPADPVVDRFARALDCR